MFFHIYRYNLPSFNSGQADDANASASSYMQETTLGDLKAFIGLLDLTGLNKFNRQSLKGLWRTDGDIFRTTMLLQRFQFLRNNEKSARGKRKKRAFRNILTSSFDAIKMRTLRVSF